MTTYLCDGYRTIPGSPQLLKYVNVGKIYLMLDEDINNPPSVTNFPYLLCLDCGGLFINHHRLLGKSVSGILVRG